MVPVTGRIQCISKVRPLFLQLEPMKALAGQLKKDKDVASSKVKILQQEMDGIVTRIQVPFPHKCKSYCIVFMEDKIASDSRLVALHFPFFFGLLYTVI